MSEKTLRRLWAVSLIVNGVCAVILGVLNILGIGSVKALIAVLCVLMLCSVSMMSIAAVRLWKKRKG